MYVYWGSPGYPHPSGVLQPEMPAVFTLHADCGSIEMTAHWLWIQLIWMAFTKRVGTRESFWLFPPFSPEAVYRRVLCPSWKCGLERATPERLSFIQKRGTQTSSLVKPSTYCLCIIHHWVNLPSPWLCTFHWAHMQQHTSSLPPQDFALSFVVSISAVNPAMIYEKGNLIPLQE